MARYCFYCNRELRPAEKCECRPAAARLGPRGAAHEASAQADAAADPQGGGGSATATRRVTGFVWVRRIWRRQPLEQARAADGAQASSAPRSQARQSQQAERAAEAQRRAGAQTGPSARARTRTRTQGAVPLRQSLGGLLLEIVRLVTQPTRAIQRQSLAHALRGSLTVLAASASCSFLIVGIFTRSNIGHLVLYRSRYFVDILPTQNRFMLFLEFWLFAFLYFIIKALTHYLVLRQFARADLSLRELPGLMTPGAVYFLLAMLLGRVFTAGSGMQAVFILAVGFMLASIIDHLALRMRLGLNEDQMLRWTMLSLLIMALIYGALLSLFLPNLTEFAVSYSNT